MNSYYLLLRMFRDEEPPLIKICEANNKEEAIEIFLQELHKLVPRDFYTHDDIEPFIKTTKELNIKERGWVRDILAAL